MTSTGHRRLVAKGGMLLAFCCAGACTPSPEAVRPAIRVQPGIDLLLGDSLALVKGKAVAIVTQLAAVDPQGVPVVDRLLRAGVHLVALFSPEHGYRGSADPGEVVASTVDSATGLPIYSLYGSIRGPTDAMLAGVDVILVDLTDVGARYFTYLGTTIEVMRSAARRRLPVIVLDRPNPIGGVVQGNVLDTAYRSFVGSLAMPMRHGLTLGELARLANLDLGLHADLRVVPVTGWRRAQTIEQTGLPFLPPSPNLRERESLFHYPGICLFEATALSVGRGTDASFTQIGAPWLDVPRVLALVTGYGLPGVSFEAVRFTPRRPGDGKFADVEIPGIRLLLTDARRYDPTLTAVALLQAVRRAHPDSIAIRATGFDRLAGGPALREALLSGAAPEAIAASWRAPLDAWLAHRRPILLYP